MEDLESKIGQILSDPDAMSSILSLVKNLGLPSSDAGPDPDAGSEPEQPQEPLGGADGGFDSLFDAIPFSVIQMLTEAGKVDTKQTALFSALKPFLKPGRREKIDKAMRIARLSHVAGFALKNWEHK